MMVEGGRTSGSYYLTVVNIEETTTLNVTILNVYTVKVTVNCSSSISDIGFPTGTGMELVSKSSTQAVLKYYILRGKNGTITIMT